MVRPYLDRIGGKLDNDVSLFTGGLNTYVDKAFLEPNQMPFVMNMTMVQPPKMETRPTRQSLAQYFTGEAYPYADQDVVNMWCDSELGFFFIFSDNDNMWLEKWSAGELGMSRDILGQLGARTDSIYFCHCWQAEEHFLYVMNEKMKYKYTFSTDVFEPISDDIYGIPEFHKGRLFIANPTTRIVTFSALYDFDNFDQEHTQYQVVVSLPTPENASKEVIYLKESPTDQNYYWQYQYVGDGTNVLWKVSQDEIKKTDVAIDGTTGYSLPDYSVSAGDFKITNALGDVVGMKSFDDKLYIFCKNSMHLLYGSTPDTTLSNQFQLVDLNNGIGAYSNKCICVGSDYLFWLGNDKQVYQHTGSYTYMISRPTEEGTGGIDNLFSNSYLGPHTQMCATNTKLFLNVSVGTNYNNVVFVYDIYNKIWWAEDGLFTSITENKSEPGEAMVFMARNGGDIVYEYRTGTGFDTDYLYNFETNKLEEVPIKYQFQTRVYGADGTDMRKSISDIWFQARADANVYLGDLWTAKSHWDAIPWVDEAQLEGYVKIGELEFRTQNKNIADYDTVRSEQQRAIVPKMYGQRVNAFSIVVTGEGKAEFFLMKRNWRVS